MTEPVYDLWVDDVLLAADVTFGEVLDLMEEHDNAKQFHVYKALD